MAEKEDIARKLEESRRQLHNDIERAIQRHQSGPIEIDMNLVEKPDSGTEHLKDHHPALLDEIQRLIGSFMDKPEVRESGVTIYKLHAADSDGDGSVALNIQFEYAVNPGMRGADRSDVGGTGA